MLLSSCWRAALGNSDTAAAAAPAAAVRLAGPGHLCPQAGCILCTQQQQALVAPVAV
jgi:hypothetical protein